MAREGERKIILLSFTPFLGLQHQWPLVFQVKDFFGLSYPKFFPH